MRTSTFFSLRTALPVAATALLLSVGACSPDQPVPALGSNGLNLTRYVAVGDSYTAGYSDGGLTNASQAYSYANLLASQFALVSPDATFSQPLLTDGAGTGYLSLVEFDAAGLPLTRRIRPASTLGRYINTAGCNGADTVYQYSRAGVLVPQNLGVPGLRLSQVATPGLGNAANLTRPGLFNPYFERLVPTNDNRSYLQVVTAASPSATFFTFFAGLDDVLPYVVSGGSCGPLPQAATLTANARLLLTQLASGGRPGIVALPPTLASLPLMRLSNALTVQERRRAATAPTDTIYVRTFTGAVQPASDKDFILPVGQRRLGRLENATGAAQTVAYGKKRNPVSGSDVLDYIEFGRIDGALTQFNEELENLAKTPAFKLPVLKTADELFLQVNGQINVNGVTYTPELVRGNFYSLDGFSLTPRGNALLANAFLRKINEIYGASIPLISVNRLPTQANP